MKTNLLNYSLATCLLVICQTSPSHAVDPKREASGGRFSQLEFDQKMIVDSKNDHNAPMVDPAEVLKVLGHEVPKTVEPKNEAKKVEVPAAESGARAALAPSTEKFITTTQEQAVKHFVAAEKGPVVDLGDANKITSLASWKKSGRCKDITSKEQLCKKSKAISEVLTRFTGKEMHSTIRCDAKCAKKNEKSRMTSITFRNISNGTFQFVEQADGCHYELARSSETAWPSLEIGKITCECLPAEC